MNLFKRLFCKHNNTYCLTNFYGDVIHWVSYHNKIIRSAYKCKDCGKILYSEYLDKDCKVINWDLVRDKDGKLVHISSLSKEEISSYD